MAQALSSGAQRKKSRHEQDYSGKARYWRSLYFIEYAINQKLITEQQAVRLYERISNLDRLVPSAEFKKALGVSYKNSSVQMLIDRETHNKVLSVVLDRVSNPSFNVSKIYTSDEKTEFLTSALDTAFPKNNKSEEITTSPNGVDKFPLPSSTPRKLMPPPKLQMFLHYILSLSQESSRTLLSEINYS